MSTSPSDSPHRGHQFLLDSGSPEEEVIRQMEGPERYRFCGNLLQAGILVSPQRGGVEPEFRQIRGQSAAELHFEPTPKGILLVNEGESTTRTLSPGEKISQFLASPSARIERLFLRCLSYDGVQGLSAVMSIKGNRFHVPGVYAAGTLSFELPPAKQDLTQLEMVIEIENKGTEPVTLEAFPSGELRFAILGADTLEPLASHPFFRKIQKAIRLLKNGEVSSLFRIVFFIVRNKLSTLSSRSSALLCGSISASLLSSALLCGSILSSCVLPPSSESPRVYSQQELEYVGSIQKGLSFSGAGRFDQAEYYFRKALQQMEQVGAPSSAALLSDLGYVLRAQGKLEAARDILLKALVQEPYLLHARATLGRAYFEMGDLDRSRKEFERVEKDYLEYWNAKPDSRLARGFETKDLVSVFSSLAVIHAHQGRIAEAVCYSQRALEQGDASYNSQAHARFLIAVLQVSLASESLRAQIAALKQEDPSLLIDLGLAHLLNDNRDLAREAFDRVLSLTVVAFDEKLLAQLLRYDIAEREKDVETIGFLREYFADSQEQLCEGPSFTAPAYFPLELQKRIQFHKNELCKQYG